VRQNDSLQSQGVFVLIWISQLAICVVLLTGFASQGWAAASVEQFRAMFKKMQALNAKGDYEAGLIVAKQFEAAAREKSGANTAGHAEGLTNLAVSYSYLGRYVESADMMKRARAIYAAEKGPNHPFVLLIDGNLAVLLAQTGDLTGAELSANRALAGYQRLNDKARIAESLSNLTQVYNAQGRFDDAERVGLQAVAASEKLGSITPKLGQALDNLGNVYSRRNKLRDAEAAFQRSLAVQEKASGPSHPFVGTTLNNYANVLSNEDRFDEAERVYQRSLSIDEKINPESPDVATVLTNIGNLRIKAGAYGEADTIINRAISIRQKARLKDINLATVLNLSGVSSMAQGKYDAAEAALKQAVSIQETIAGPKYALISASLNLLGKVASAQRRYDEAEAYFARANEIYLASYGEANEYKINNDLDLVKLFEVRGDLDRALDMARKTTALVTSNLATSLATEPLARDGKTVADRSARIHISVLAAIASRDGTSTPEITREAIEIAQYGDQTATGTAVQQMAAPLCDKIRTCPVSFAQAANLWSMPSLKPERSTIRPC
jgi:tetratricopeptide (TPR) repeat protein